MWAKYSKTLTHSAKMLMEVRALLGGKGCFINRECFCNLAADA
jgi:hypothetical protein